MPLRANNSPFMTKQLRKMIMNRSSSKNLCLKNKTVENWDKYRKLTEYYRNINIQYVIWITESFGKQSSPILQTKIKPRK